MKKVLNILLNISKYVLLIAAFGITLVIILQMNRRLQKDFNTVIVEFVPFLILFILFILNLIFRQKGVTENLFYNVTCCLVFSVVLVVGYRSFNDKNMVLNEKYGYGIDFNYFNNFISYMKIMLYGLIASNILFMFQPKDKKKIK